MCRFIANNICAIEKQGKKDGSNENIHTLLESLEHTFPPLHSTNVFNSLQGETSGANHKLHPEREDSSLQLNIYFYNKTVVCTKRKKKKKRGEYVVCCLQYMCCSKPSLKKKKNEVFSRVCVIF